MNLSYAGTHLTNGKAANGSACVKGFDQAGFIMGTSASLFNVRLSVYRRSAEIHDLTANIRLCAQHSPRVF
jgi:lysophospholipase